MSSFGRGPGGGGDGDEESGFSFVDGDGSVWLAAGDEVAGVEVAMVLSAEQSEDFDVGEAVVFEPLHDVMDLAEVGGDGAVGVEAASVAGDDS